MTLDKKDYENNLKSTVEETKVETDKIKKEFNEVDKSTQQVSKSFEKNIGIIALSSVVNLGNVIAQTSQKVLNFFTNTLDYADKYGDLSAKYDIASQSLQRFEYIASQSGTTLDGVLSVMTMMYNKAKENGEVFEKLGVSVRDTSGNMKAMDTLFWEVKSALDKVNNSGEKSALMLEVFGRNAMSVGEFLRKDSDELEYLGEKAEDLGIILEDKTIDTAGKFNDVLDEMRLRGKTAFADLVAGAEGSRERFEDFMNDFTATIQTFIPVFAEVGVNLGGELLKGIAKGLGSFWWGNLKNSALFTVGKGWIWDRDKFEFSDLFDYPITWFKGDNNLQTALDTISPDGYTPSPKNPLSTSTSNIDNSTYNISIETKEGITPENAEIIGDMIIKRIATEKQSRR